MSQTILLLPFPVDLGNVLEKSYQQTHHIGCVSITSKCSVCGTSQLLRKIIVELELINVSAVCFVLIILLHQDDSLSINTAFHEVLNTKLPQRSAEGKCSGVPISVYIDCLKTSLFPCRAALSAAVSGKDDEITETAPTHYDCTI